MDEVEKCHFRSSTVQTGFKTTCLTHSEPSVRYSKAEKNIIKMTCVLLARHGRVSQKK